MADRHTGAGLSVHMCVPVLASTAPDEMRSLLLLHDFIVFMVCIISTHPQPPPSEQLDKIHLMVCQKVCFFPSTRLSCSVLCFSNNQSDLPQSQRDASTERRHGTAIAPSLNIELPLLLQLH